MYRNSTPLRPAQTIAPVVFSVCLAVAPSARIDAPGRGGAKQDEVGRSEPGVTLRSHVVGVVALLCIRSSGDVRAIWRGHRLEASPENLKLCSVR